MQNVYLVLQIQHLILAELVARVKKVTADHLIWQIVKVYIHIYIYIYISVWSFPNHYRFLRVPRPKEDHFGFVYENSKCSKEQKALQCYVLLNA